MFTWTLIDNDSGATEVLTKDPKGWEDLTLKHERGGKWHGVTYDFTSELGFFCKGGGKELVDNAYERKEQEADVTLTLDVKCNGTYKRIFTGKLDFSSYRQEWIAGVLYSYLNTDDRGIKNLINIREDLKVDLLRTESLSDHPIPNYPFAPYEISMHSKVIKLVSSWENTLDSSECARFPTAQLTHIKIAEWFKVKGELKESNDIFAGIEQGLSNRETNFLPLVELADAYEYPFDVTFTWDVSGTFADKAVDALGNAICDPSNPPATILRRTTLQLIQPTNEPSEGWILLLKIGQTYESATPWILAELDNGDYFTGGDYADTFSSSGSITAQVNRGDKIWLLWCAGYSIDAGAYDVHFTFDYDKANFTIVSDTTTPPSKCSGIAIHEAWSRLSSFITDSPIAFYSEFFGRTDSNIVYQSDGCGSRTAITSGLNIRGFTNSEIKTSLKDLYDACNSIWAIGLGVENYNGHQVIRVEPVYYFYQDKIILTLENVPNIRMTHLPNRVYNEVNIGFQDWETESTGGLDEPNARVQYAIPVIKHSKNSLDLLCPYVGGMYAIEITRRLNHLDFATKDSKYDEKLFFICLNKTDLSIPETNENFSLVTGLLSPETAYNLRLSLNATFNRVKYLITPGLTKLGSPNPVKMIPTGEGNRTMQYQFIPDGCDGDSFGSLQQNIKQQVFPDPQARRENPTWLAQEYTFDYPLGFEDYLTLITNPYGLIKFSDAKNNVFYGWIDTLKYNLRQKSASFKLIARYKNATGGGNTMTQAGLGEYDPRDYHSGEYFTG